MRLDLSLKHYFFSEFPIWPVAVARIGLGFIYFFYLVFLGSDFTEIFGSSGLGAHHLFVFRDPWIGGLYVCGLVCSVAVILGIYSRLAVALLALFASLLLWQSPNAFWGWGLMGRQFLLLLFFCHPGEVLSLDVWLRGVRARQSLTAWRVRLFQCQIMMIYFIAVPGRLNAWEWLDGSALAIALKDPLFSRFPDVDWLNRAEALRPLTYGALILEGLGVVMGFIPMVGRWIAVLLVTMHTTMEATLLVQYWQPVMILGLLFFIPLSCGKSAQGPCTKHQRWIILGFTFYHLSVLAQAVGPTPGPVFAEQARASLAWPLEKLGLIASGRMRMFQTTRRTSLQCLVAWPDRPEGSHIPVYTSPLECLGESKQWRQDEVYASLIRLLMYERQSKIARFLCARAPSGTPSIVLTELVGPIVRLESSALVTVRTNRSGLRLNCATFESHRLTDTDSALWSLRSWDFLRALR